jgi:hypothetical protein
MLVAVEIRIQDLRSLRSDTNGEGGKGLMDAILQMDFHQLMSDTEKIRGGLEKLGEDYASWARNQEESDLAEIFEYIKTTETDLSITLSDSVAAHDASANDEARLALVDLHEAYAYLNALFNDFKKAAAGFNYAYIHPHELERLEVDWRRLEKTVGRARKDLEEEEKVPALWETR